MFGISVRTTDLLHTIDLNTKRYFSMMLTIGSTVNGVATKQIYVPMEKCTVEHWKMLPDVSERFDALQASKWLCPPMNYEFPLQGAYSSTVHSGVILHVTNCVNSTMFSQPCAPQSEIDQLIRENTNFFLNVNYINPVISPSQSDHISYYL